MHLGNGAITPECALVTWLAGGTGLAAAAVACRRELTFRQLAHASAWGTFVLGAQAINVPLGWGTSAHLVGGVLLASVLGPGLGAWTMAAILAFQALVLGDGSLFAFGANTLNMALLPAGLVALARLRLGNIHGPRERSVLAGLAGVSVVLAAAAIVVETAAFRPWSELAAWPRFAMTMVGIHSVIGILEAAGTWLLFALALPLSRPLLPPAKFYDRPHWMPVLGIGLLLVVMAIGLEVTSQWPDGYERAAEVSGISHLLLKP